MAKSNLIIPDFTEDLVAFMVQMMLTITRFPRVPFAMVPLSKKSERIYGADVKIESIAPLYIQFKRSLAYPDFSTAKFLSDRKGLNLNNSPRVLYFELRKKDKKHKDFQHNILLDLRNKLKQKGVGDAVYCAPLFLNRSTYMLSVHINSMLHWRPWNFSHCFPFPKKEFNLITKNGNINFQNCPVLKNHITIPPFMSVDTYKHRYSFLESGNETCFHSPSIIENTNKLDHFISEFIRFDNGVPNTKMLNIEESIFFLNELNREYFSEEVIDEKQESILDDWLEFGDKLKERYDIEQYMLIKFKCNMENT